MPTSGLESLPPAEILRASIEVALASVDGPIVLAVSGGQDSMALLFAMARWGRQRIAAVATFDHASGGYATEAASLVAAEGRRLELTVVRERARVSGSSEAAWREARWNFLHRVARAYRARIATAHTRDDQAETIVMRALRGAGARGLAGLAAPSPIVRPWLGAARSEVRGWAESEGVPFLEDPSNASSRFLRGRIRHDLLPAFERVRPGISSEFLEIGERAAAWRRETERLVDELGTVVLYPGTLRVPAAPLVAMSDAGRGVVWPALFARVGVVLDARGTRELIRFTNANRRGAMVTLAKGAMAILVSMGGEEWFELRRGARLERRTLEFTGRARELPPRLGAWRFRRSAPPPEGAVEDPWMVALPSSETVQVRRWLAGDRIRTAGAPTGRRVTRYFAEAKVPALDRLGWPVVLVEGELAWVPGISRSLAAPYRPGRSDLIWYRCEREHD